LASIIYEKRIFEKWKIKQNINIGNRCSLQIWIRYFRENSLRCDPKKIGSTKVMKCK
jgi:hypothetical protein